MILYNNQLIEKADMHLSPDDRGYYFGDGIYEVIRVYEGRIFEKEAHLQRLARSALGTKIRLPYTLNEIGEKLDMLLHAEQISEGIIYMQITRGAAPRAHPFPLGVEPVLYAYCIEVKRPLKAIRHGITAVTIPDIRWLRCDLKTINLLPSVLAKQEAIDQGADEAILHRDGTITECSASNLIIVHNDVLQTHPLNNFILHGITRAVVLKLAIQLELTVIEASFTLETLFAADEVFLTSTTAEVTPIISINGQPIGDGKPGKITLQLQSAFEQKLNLLL